MADLNNSENDVHKSKQGDKEGQMAPLISSESDIPNSNDDEEIFDLTEEDKKKIVEMAQEGHGPREIARELGVSHPRVIQILEEIR